MNGPLSMYKTRQIVRHDIAVELPKCMYPMKNVQGSKNGLLVEHQHHSPPSDRISLSNKKLDIFDQNNLNTEDPEMAELEQRQQQILQQLADLKEQMNKIRNQLKVVSVAKLPKCTVKAQPVSKVSQKAQSVLKPQFDPKSLPTDVVINVNPNNPPYSLEKIQNLLQNYVGISIKSFLHSSVSALSEDAAVLVKKLEKFRARNGAPKIFVRLIWKDVRTNLELLVTPIPIEGEVNLLRYISRLVPNIIPYETSNQLDEIDSLLDITYKLVKSRTKTERAQILRLLNKALGKEQFLTGPSFTVVDLAAFSAIKQTTPSTELTVNLGNWLERVDNV